MGIVYTKQLFSGDRTLPDADPVVVVAPSGFTTVITDISGAIVPGGTPTYVIFAVGLGLAGCFIPLTLAHGFGALSFRGRIAMNPGDELIYSTDATSGIIGFTITGFQLALP